MKIIVIGAGLGGLTAGFRLAKSGHDVHVVERAPSLKSRGGGISIRASAARHMQSWGLGEDLDEICDRSASVTYRDLTTGKELNTVNDAPENRDWGATRKALMTLLNKRAIEAGARFSFDATVVAVSEDDEKATATVTLADGREMSADLVLAADGIKSHTRRYVLADLGPWEQFEPVIDHTTLYNFEADISQLTNDPSTRVISRNSNLTVWMGSSTKEGYIIGRFSDKIQGVRLLCAIHEEDQADQEATVLWKESGDVEHVRRCFAGAYADIADVLRVCDSCSRWKIAEMPDLPRWSSRKGRIALLGDSAHGMHPNVGQGYATIIEDIGVLDYLISLLPPRGGESGDAIDIPQTLRTWEAICKPRAERIKAFAHWTTLNFTGRSSTGKSRADIETYAKTTGTVGEGVGEEDGQGQDLPGRDAHFKSAAFLKWNSAYDSIKEANAYLARQGREN